MLGQSSPYPTTPPSQTITEVFYDASSNTRYTCTAPAILPYSAYTPALPSTISIAAGSLTNIVVSGGTATVTVSSTSSWNAGTYDDMSIVVSGSATTALNGAYVVTSQNTQTTTFTFTTTASNGTYTDSTLQISTNNPLLTQLAWSLTVFTYDSSSRTTGILQVNAGYQFACSSRSNY